MEASQRPTNAVLTISNAQIIDDGGYSVIVTNVFGAVPAPLPLC